MIPGRRLRDWLDEPARTGAGAAWLMHPALAEMRGEIGALAGEPETIAAAISGLFESRAGWIGSLLADVIAALWNDDFAAIPFPIIQDATHSGVVLIDTPAAMITLASASADAIAARKMRPGPRSVSLTGHVSVIHMLRAPGATFRFWRRDGDRVVPDGEQAFGDGGTLLIDGRERGYSIVRAAGDIVMLRATVKPGAAQLVREFDAGSGLPVAVSANDESASRVQMMLTLLRLLGRNDAANCFAHAAGEPQHFLRWHAMREWLALDAPAAIPHLRRLAERDAHPDVRHAARATLHRIADPCPA